MIYLISGNGIHENKQTVIYLINNKKFTKQFIMTCIKNIFKSMKTPIVCSLLSKDAVISLTNSVKI